MKRCLNKIISFLLCLLLLLPAPKITISADNQIENKQNKERVMIELGDHSKEEVIAFIRNNERNASIKHEFDELFNGFSIDLSASTILKLKLSGLVKKVHKTNLYYPLMTSSAAITNSDKALNQFNDGSGLVISIIDSGIDTSHQDLSFLPKPELAKIKEIKQSSQTTYSIKIPYGKNFVDGNDIVKDSTSSMHGIHVAGIAGAYKQNKDGINGIAPGSQLLAMKVFSNDPNKKGAQDDDIIAAIEDSIEKGADIINMSLGSDAGFNNPNDPMIRAINKAKEKGVLVVVAAGNSQVSTTNSSSSDDILNHLGLKDIALVSSPSVADGALSVASYENTHTLASLGYLRTKLDASDHSEDQDFSYTKAFQEPKLKGMNDLVFVNFAKEEDFIGKDVKDKVALIFRGEISFREKIDRALSKGAKAIIMANNQEASFGMAGLEGLEDKFIVTVTKSIGDKLNIPNAKVEFKDELYAIESTSANKMSTFSSWGSTVNLDFKPEISAVGGNVYSSQNDNKYATSSGTSMAAPHLAGASAIIINEVKNKYSLSGEELVDFVRNTMLNTAKVISNPDNDNLPYSLRRQGAGLLDTLSAIKNPTTITVNNKAVGELREFKDSKQLSLTFTNHSNDSVSYSFNKEKSFLLSQMITEENKVKEIKVDGDITLSTETIDLGPKESKTITFSLKLNEVLENFLEGSLVFEAKDDKPNLHFAFMGYSGDYSAEDAIDDLNPSTSKLKLPPALAISRPFFFAPPSVVSPGYDSEKEVFNADEIAFSPNGDNSVDALIPQLGLLRNVTSISASILDENKEKELIKLGESNYHRRLSYEKYSSLENKKVVYPIYDFLWDGKLYNPLNGEMEVAKEGKYYYRFDYRLSDNAKTQSKYLPIILDVTKPNAELIKQNDSDYEIVDGNRLVRFRISDNSKILNVSATMNNEEIKITKSDQEDVYTISAPFTANNKDSINLLVSDIAYNINTFDFNISGIDSDIKMDRFVTKKLTASFNSDLYPKGKTSQEASKLVVTMEHLKDENVVVNKEYKVSNGLIRGAFDGIVLPKQGIYQTYFTEKDANDNALKTIDFGKVRYDYEAPKISFIEGIQFDGVEKPLSEILDLGLDEYNLGSSKAYEVIVTKNPDGSATLKGVVSDEASEPKDIIFTRGQQIAKINIDDEGNFDYTYEPGTNVDFFNLKDPDLVNTDISFDLDALDLASYLEKATIRGKRSIIVVKYLENENPEDKEEEKADKPNYRVNIDDLENITKLGKAALDGKYANLVEEDGAYFYKLTGNTNALNARVYINGENLVDDNIYHSEQGTNFNKKIPVNEGKNLINYRVEDENGELIVDTAIKLYIDLSDPVFELDETDLTIAENANPDYSATYQTEKDSIRLRYKASDNGAGYTLAINGSNIISIDELNDWSNNERSGFIDLPLESYESEEGTKYRGIITVSLVDSFSNEVRKKYLINEGEDKEPRAIEFESVNYESTTLGKTQDLIIDTNIYDDEFVNVIVDGKILNAEHYSFKDSILTLSKDYLENLRSGVHNVAISSMVGTKAIDITLIKEILSEDSIEHDKYSGLDALLTLNLDDDEFKEILIDDAPVDLKKYRYEANILRLNTSLLDSLGKGSHTLRIVSTTSIKDVRVDIHNDEISFDLADKQDEGKLLIISSSRMINPLEFIHISIDDEILEKNKDYLLVDNKFYINHAIYNRLSNKYGEHMLEIKLADDTIRHEFKYIIAATNNNPSTTREELINEAKEIFGISRDNSIDIPKPVTSPLSTDDKANNSTTEPNSTSDTNNTSTNLNEDPKTNSEKESDKEANKENVSDNQSKVKKNNNLALILILLFGLGNMLIATITILIVKRKNKNKE